MDEKETNAVRITHLSECELGTANQWLKLEIFFFEYNRSNVIIAPPSSVNLIAKGNHGLSLPSDNTKKNMNRKALEEEEAAGYVQEHRN